MADPTPPPDADWTTRAAQVLATEHFTLQGARAATISESTGRASMYLMAISSSLVALGFIGQSSGMGIAFDVLALILLPTLFFLGVATVTRVTQSGVEDLLYARGINRIRHFYLEYVPEAAPYLILSANDDMEGVLHNMGLKPGRGQPLLTVGGMIGVINSVVLGAFFGLLTNLLDPPLGVSVAVGATAFAASVAGHIRFQRSMYMAWGGEKTVRFPSSPAFPNPDQNQQHR